MAKREAKKIERLEDLQPDAANVNKGTERGNFQLDWSLTNLGAWRSIAASADGVVAAGNQTLQRAADHGLKIRPVHTTGDELVVVIRDDITSDDPRFRQYAVADNRVSELNYAPDVEVLLSHAQSVDLSAMYREDEIDALMAGLIPDGVDEGEGKDSTAASSDDPSTEPEFKGIYALQEDVIFPSTNEWGIPDLLPEMCSDQIPDTVYARQEAIDSDKTLYVHGTAKFDQSAQGGVLAFYVDDFRFESVWLDAVRMVEQFKSAKWGSVVAPDFSVWRDDPKVMQAWNIYRSRWCARYWQEAGLKVIPSLNWADERSYDFAHIGIPKNLPVVSVQCRTTRSRKGKEHFGKGLAHAIETLSPQNVLVYGGAEHRQWIEPLLPEGVAYHWLESWTSLRRKLVFNKGIKNESQT